MFIHGFVIVFAVALTQVSCDEPREPHFLGPMFFNMENMEQCLSELGLEKGQFQNREPGPPTQNEFCLMKCYTERRGVIKDDGSVDIENMKKNIPAHMKDHADTITACVQKLDTIITCEDIGKMIKCFPLPNQK